MSTSAAVGYHAAVTPDTSKRAARGAGSETLAGPDAIDVAVIGAGVVGLSVARELLRLGLTVVVLEAEEDIGRQASGRNSGVVHPGFSVAPGTLKAKLNVQGSRLIRDLCRELDVPFSEVGTLVVARTDDELPALEPVLEAGVENGLTGLQIVGAQRARELEPSVAGTGALFAPQGAILDPFTLVQRIAEQVLANGGVIRVGSEVVGLVRPTEGEGAGSWRVSAGGLAFRTRAVVNAAGVAAAGISAMAGGESYESYPCRGEYLVLDKAARGVPGRMVYPVPPKTGGLGVHFTPTTHGNTLIGPSAEYVADGLDYATSPGVLAELVAQARDLCPGFEPRDVISTFAGVRAKIAKGSYGQTDFVVRESETAPGLFNLVGIESPGLSASPAIARYVGELVAAMFAQAKERELVAPAPPPARFDELDDAERARLAAEEPGWDTIVCRCERVTRAEVLAALDNPYEVRSLTAVKVRCRAGTGRCQGGFCGPRIVDTLVREKGVPPEEVTLKGPGSELLAGSAKVLFES